MVDAIRLEDKVDKGEVGDKGKTTNEHKNEGVGVDNDMQGYECRQGAWSKPYSSTLQVTSGPRPLPISDRWTD